jgi:ubiquinone/menaquinone biosynthesis C-methylase UbiE
MSALQDNFGTVRPQIMPDQVSDSLKMEDAALRERSRLIWTSGDFGRIARSLAVGGEEFISRLAIKPQEWVLDVACGTGNLAIPAARSGAKVVGQDIASNLLQQARERADSEGLEIQFDEGDAEQMPYHSGMFATVVSMFGAMFAAHPDRMAQELVRVCRSGGRVALGNWTPEGFIGQMLKMVSGYVPPPPGLPSVLLWGDEKTVRERFSAGIADLRLTKRLLTMEFPFPPHETVAYFRAYYGPTVKAFAALDAGRQSALCDDLIQLWSAHNQAKDGTTRVEAEYMEVIATKA